MTPSSLLFLRTVGNLRPAQVMHRIKAQVKRKLRVNSSHLEFVGENSPRVRADFPGLVPVGKEMISPQGVRDLAEGVFEHLNQVRFVGKEDPDWRLGRCDSERLWTITLHYHEWAYDLIRVASRREGQSLDAAELFRHYVGNWISRCDLQIRGSRDLAWNSYAIATRIGWWIQSFLLANQTSIIRDDAFWDRYLRSLWKQAKYLSQNLEYDLRANHLLRDALGLAWAGRFFDEREADRWLHTAEELVVAQAIEQVLPDGGHFERSPMYHVHMMGDLLSAALLLDNEGAVSVVRETWSRMADFLFWNRHPDGQIPLFNDAALNSSCTPDRMLSLGHSLLGLPVPEGTLQGGRSFPDFGSVVWHGEPWTIFLDTGPIGVTYQLGHAHADTLTMEASFRGNRFIVDPGTWGYDMDARREYDRSTAAHNTVCLDGRNSSEVWHIFRCGRMASPGEVRFDASPSGFRAFACHDGYRYLPGRPQVEREVILDSHQCLRVKDRCLGTGRHRVTGGWLLAPDWSVEEIAGGWHASSPHSGTVKILIRSPLELKLRKCSRWYHPEFGKEQEAIRLEWAFDGPLPLEVESVFATH